MLVRSRPVEEVILTEDHIETSKRLHCVFLSIKK